MLLNHTGSVYCRVRRFVEVPDRQEVKRCLEEKSWRKQNRRDGVWLDRTGRQAALRPGPGLFQSLLSSTSSLWCFGQIIKQVCEMSQSQTHETLFQHQHVSVGQKSVYSLLTGSLVWCLVRAEWDDWTATATGSWFDLIWFVSAFVLWLDVEMSGDFSTNTSKHASVNGATSPARQQRTI